MDRNVCITWGGVASCGVSAVMWIISRHEGKKAKELSSANPLSSVAGNAPTRAYWHHAAMSCATADISGADIAVCVADSLAKFAPVLIAIRGKTGSEEPIIAEITSTAAVLAEITEELSALKQNEKGDWLPDTQLIRRQKWETNWFISDGTDMRLPVQNSLSADLLRGSMLITAQEYREGSRSVYSRILDRLTGYRPMGVRKTERVLPIDSVVTVVGELAKASEDSKDNKLVVRKPSNSTGRPFYVTKQTLNELQTSLSRVATTCKWLAFGFGAVGIIIAGGQTIRHVKSAMRYRRIRKQLEEDEKRRRQQQVPNGDCPNSRPQNQNNLDRGKCIICWDNIPDAVFIPCGHLCACLRCSLVLNKCPVCRSRCTVHKIFST